MLEHRRGLELKTITRSALTSSPQAQAYQPDLRENSAAATGRRRTPLAFKTERERDDCPSESEIHYRSDALTPAETTSRRHHRRGGIGGLALAQGLRKSGVSVAVYERDGTRTDRVQGYRVHINPTGSAALHECLPPHLFDAFARTCGKPTKGIRFVTEHGKVLLAVDEMNVPERFDAIVQHRSVSRITLRQVLLSGLEGVVHFGKAWCISARHSCAMRIARTAA